MTNPPMMQAMRLTARHASLRRVSLAVPAPGPGQLLLRVSACAVCRTDLHVVDGELPGGKLPITPGHEIIGRVVQAGEGVAGFAIGERVGVPWLGFSCGVCEYCRSGRENLCPEARFTGHHIDGGYAEYTLADHRYCFRIPPQYGDAAAAPLLCAGLIGYRTLRFAGNARRLGIYGFGAAAHIAAQVARHAGQSVFAFTRPGDIVAQAFARGITGGWAGGSDEAPPEPLDAALIFAPVGDLVPIALRALAPGGTVVCGGIHMSDIPAFPYAWLWEERSIRSVANLTRRDAEEFLALAGRVRIDTTTTLYPLDQANEALRDLREGHLSGAAVLIPGSGGEAGA